MIVEITHQYVPEHESDTSELDVPFSAAYLCVDLLLCGETGTGKDTLAKRIHELSARRGPFVGLNCAAIPEALAESQLFGVTSGAFTGATRARPGYIEASHGGTLYLDEIDSMPLALQAKLLRVLEARGVERLGSTSFLPLDLRVIASAQRSLAELVEQGAFRQDLFFRLNGVTVHLAPLRERREQILPLFHAFCRSAAASLQRALPALDTCVAPMLLSHPWPGNIRELNSAAKRFVMGASPLSVARMDAEKEGAGLRRQMRQVEKALINDALRRHANCLDSVALELSIPKRTLYQKMKELGL